MFENIIGQRSVVAALSTELAAGAFPRASLFVGPPFAGKLSTALEAARVLTCAVDGAWSCECPACRQQRELVHPHTVMLGWRYADVEIPASAAALQANRGNAARYLYLRAVRKLLRRFEPTVWDADDARMRAAQEKTAQVEEAIEALAPGRDLPPADELAAVTERVGTLCRELAQSVRSDLVTVGQVRLLSAWAHVTAPGSRKVAIVENADRMQEAARNALLKLLEEPPVSVHLMLLTTRRSSLSPTMLSRLRPYLFPGRSPEDEREVIARIFRDESGRFTDLRGFFLAWREISPERLSAAARGFLDRALDPEAGLELPDELAALLAQRRARDGGTDAARGREKDADPSRSREAAIAFLEELSSALRTALRSGGAGVDLLEGWAAAVRECHARIETLNVAPATALLALAARLRERPARGGRLE
jgi:DNA polymerase III delta prime subunit